MGASAGDADGFWRWFAKSQSRFRDVEVAGKDALLDELQDHLHAYCDELYFEIGGMPGGTTELIITAEGKRALFPLVKELIARAPTLEGWSFIAFRPAQGFDFVTRSGRAEIDPKACWFLPLESKSSPDLLGISVGCPTFAPSLRKDFEFAVWIVLHTILGEIRVAEEVAHVEITSLPAKPEDDGFIELSELPRYLDWKKAKRAGC
jgi:hypothetical protein